MIRASGCVQLAIHCSQPDKGLAGKQVLVKKQLESVINVHFYFAQVASKITRSQSQRSSTWTANAAKKKELP